MPVARSWARLQRLRDREIDNAKHSERRFRIGLHTMLNIQYHVGIVLQRPPETQQEFKKRQKIEHGKGQPNWGRIEDARRRWDKHYEAVRDALDHGWHFENLFRFSSPQTGEGHLYPEPPPKPTEDERRAYYERRNRESTEAVITMLRNVKKARRERQAKTTPGGAKPAASPEAQRVVKQFERDLSDVREARDRLER